MALSDGDNAILDDVFSYQQYNKLKNHWYAATAPSNPQAGMIWIDSDNGKVYKYYGAAWVEISDFSDGGEAGGANRSLGNTDGYSLSLITNNANGIVISAAGEVTKPLTPSFLAYASDISNVTGDNTLYTVVFGSEAFDQGGNFDGVSYTAPVTGKHLLIARLEVGGITANHLEAHSSIVTSNRTYRLDYIEAKSIDVSGILGGFGGSVIADMDASDTATVTIQVTQTDKTVDIRGGTSPAISFFCGALIN